MLISTVDFYHFIPLSVTLTLADGSQAQHKPELVGFIFLHIFQLIRMQLDVMLKQFMLKILIMLLDEIYMYSERREISAVVLTVS